MVNSNSKPIYLPIRSLGDFVMTASVVKMNCVEKVPIMLPHYLVDLFKAMELDGYFEFIGIIAYKDQPSYFEFYKVRDLKNIKRLISDIFLIRNNLKKINHYLLDYRSRRLVFANKRFSWPNDKENAYIGKYELFSKYYSCKPDVTLSQIVKYKIPVKSIIIFPDSRIKSKEIDKGLISDILVKYGSDYQVKIAKFSSIPSNDEIIIHYSDFHALINIIKTNDFIISAESLPYHLCNFYNKPHFVIYKKVRHFKINFRTLFMISENAYTIYDGTNKEEIFINLDRVLSI